MLDSILDYAATFIGLIGGLLFWYFIFLAIRKVYRGIKGLFSGSSKNPSESQSPQSSADTPPPTPAPAKTESPPPPAPEETKPTSTIDTSRDGYADFEEGEREFENVAKGYGGNILTAYEHYRIASEKGIGEASNMMGVISERFWDTLHGHWQSGDCAIFYERGANQGCVEAMANLARVHLVWQPGGGDYEYHRQQAYYWNAQAAERGYVEAMLALADLYSGNREGDNSEETYRLICAAASTGDMRGVRLKQMAESGRLNMRLSSTGIFKGCYYICTTFIPFRAKSTCYTPSPTLYHHDSHTADAYHILASYYDESIID